MSLSHSLLYEYFEKFGAPILMPQASNAWLRRKFKELNKKYFGNLLDPDTYVRFGFTMDLGNCGFDENGDGDILISRKIKFSRMLSGPTLLHEMVHLENPNWRGHGWRFNRRMKELIQKGAMDEWL